MKYLVAHDIDTSRLTAKGYGEADPVVSNKPGKAAPNNWRVELRITNR